MCDNWLNYILKEIIFLGARQFISEKKSGDATDYEFFQRLKLLRIFWSDYQILEAWQELCLNDRRITPGWDLSKPGSPWFHITRSVKD